MSFFIPTNPYNTIIRFEFLGWADDHMGEEHHWSVQYFLEEAYAQRTEPKLTLDIYLEYKGDIIEVRHNSHDVTPEQIENFFSRSGLRVRRAESFMQTVPPTNPVISLLLLPPFILIAIIGTVLRGILYFTSDKDESSR